MGTHTSDEVKALLLELRELLRLQTKILEGWSSLEIPPKRRRNTINAALGLGRFARSSLPTNQNPNKLLAENPMQACFLGLHNLVQFTYSLAKFS